MEKDTIKDLFQDKLSQIETPVRPELWASVSSSIAGGTATTVGGSGMSVLAKITIGITIAASVTGAFVFLFKEEIKETPKTEEKKVVEQKQPESNLTKSNTENNSIPAIPNNSKQQNKAPENKISITNTIEELASHNSSAPNAILVEKPISYTQLESKEEVKNTVISPKFETSQIVQKQVNQPIPTVEKLPEESKIQLNLPNIFTPNGDGNNDYLKINIQNVSEFIIVVMDAKSNVVYKSEDVDFKWDGTNLQGDKLPAGNYLYYVTAKDNTGKPVTKYSPLTIKY
jgi:gliding motility-associated-like protein